MCAIYLFSAAPLISIINTTIVHYNDFIIDTVGGGNASGRDRGVDGGDVLGEGGLEEWTCSENIVFRANNHKFLLQHEIFWLLLF